MKTVERFETLEWELAAAKRRFRQLLIVIGLVGTVFVLSIIFARTADIAQARAYEKAEKLIRANGFALEDEYGNLKAALGVDKGNPILAMYDKNGNPRVMLAVMPSGAGLLLQDKNGRVIKEFICQ